MRTLTMLHINKGIFSANLRLTQDFCLRQMAKKETDPARIFRSANPTHDNHPFFSFKVETVDVSTEPNVKCCTMTKWTIDPTDPGSENIVPWLFEEQIRFKQREIASKEHSIHQGDILVSEVDGTVLDGASEVQSLGLIDIYDLPPIDTWFYWTKGENGRLLFSWIPQEFVGLANEAVEVNPLDCLHWFHQWLPEEYQRVYFP